MGLLCVYFGVEHKWRRHAMFIITFWSSKEKTINSTVSRKQIGKQVVGVYRLLKKFFDFKELGWGGGGPPPTFLWISLKFGQKFFAKNLNCEFLGSFLGGGRRGVRRSDLGLG